MALGLVEGIEAHAPLLWDGGSIQIQASAHEADVGRAMGAVPSRRRIAGHSAPPPARHRGGGQSAGRLPGSPPGDLGAIDLLEGVCEHGPAVLAMTDVGRTARLPRPGAVAPAGGGAVVLAAGAGHGEPASSSSPPTRGRFTSSTRGHGGVLDAPRARQGRRRGPARGDPPAPTCALSARARRSSRARASRPSLACVPLEPAPIGAPPLGADHRSRWTCEGQLAHPLPASETAALVSNARFPP